MCCLKSEFGIDLVLKKWNPSKVETCCGLYRAASMHNNQAVAVK